MPAKPRLLVTRQLHPAVEQRLADLFTAELNPRDHIFSPDALVERATNWRAEGLLVCLSDRLSADTIFRLPASLKVISTYSVGLDHIDLDAARHRRIVVTYTPDAVTEATADCALLLLLAACRQAHAFRDRMWKGEWRGWTPVGLLGSDPGGKVLGIVGLGRIGRALARRARALGMEIAYHNRRRLPPELEEGARYHETLEGLFRASHVLSLHAPSTPETRGLIDRERLSWLPEGTVLINTARGDLVVDDDLIAALGSGRLAAAGLDVFAGEPDFDRRYLDLANVFVLPHIGTSTQETRVRMGEDAIAGLQAVFAGREPPWRAA